MWRRHRDAASGRLFTYPTGSVNAEDLWLVCTTADGAEYYHNIRKKVTTWKLPEVDAEVVVGDDGAPTAEMAGSITTATQAAKTPSPPREDNAAVSTADEMEADSDEEGAQRRLNLKRRLADAIKKKDQRNQRKLSRGASPAPAAATPASAAASDAGASRPGALSPVQEEVVDYCLRSRMDELKAQPCGACGEPGDRGVCKVSGRTHSRVPVQPVSPPKTTREVLNTATVEELRALLEKDAAGGSPPASAAPSAAEPPAEPSPQDKPASKSPRLRDMDLEVAVSVGSGRTDTATAQSRGSEAGPAGVVVHDKRHVSAASTPTGMRADYMSGVVSPPASSPVHPPLGGADSGGEARLHNTIASRPSEVRVPDYVSAAATPAGGPRPRSPVQDAMEASVPMGVPPLTSGVTQADCLTEPESRAAAGGAHRDRAGVPVAHDTRQHSPASDGPRTASPVSEGHTPWPHLNASNPRVVRVTANDLELPFVPSQNSGVSGPLSHRSFSGGPGPLPTPFASLDPPHPHHAAVAYPSPSVPATNTATPASTRLATPTQSVYNSHYTVPVPATRSASEASRPPTPAITPTPVPIMPEAASAPGMVREQSGMRGVVSADTPSDSHTPPPSMTSPMAAAVPPPAPPQSSAARAAPPATPPPPPPPAHKTVFLAPMDDPCGAGKVAFRMPRGVSQADMLRVMRARLGVPATDALSLHASPHLPPLETGGVDYNTAEDNHTYVFSVCSYGDEGWDRAMCDVVERLVDHYGGLRAAYDGVASYDVGVFRREFEKRGLSAWTEPLLHRMDALGGDVEGAHFAPSFRVFCEALDSQLPTAFSTIDAGENAPASHRRQVLARLGDALVANFGSLNAAFAIMSEHGALNAQLAVMQLDRLGLPAGSIRALLSTCFPSGADAPNAPVIGFQAFCDVLDAAGDTSCAHRTPLPLGLLKRVLWAYYGNSPAQIFRALCGDDPGFANIAAVLDPHPAQRIEHITAGRVFDQLSLSEYVQGFMEALGEDRSYSSFQALFEGVPLTAAPGRTGRQAPVRPHPVLPFQADEVRAALVSRHGSLKGAFEALCADEGGIDTMKVVRAFAAAGVPDQARSFVTSYNVRRAEGNTQDDFVLFALMFGVNMPPAGAGAAGGAGTPREPSKQAPPALQAQVRDAVKRKRQAAKRDAHGGSAALFPHTTSVQETLTYPDGSTYSGAVVRGVRQGRGRLTHGLATHPTWFYDGEWRDGEPHGDGAMTWVGRGHYAGEWQHGAMHGVGRLYVGNLKLESVTMQDDVIDGPVQIQYPSGDVYKGEMAGARLGGKGKVTHANGDVYQWRWADPNKPGTGRARLRYKVGDVYEGELRHYKKHGRGKFVFAAGHVYEGGFAGGHMSGEGTFRYQDGSVYEGGMRDDVFEGRGRYVDADGQEYVGAWREGRMHGHGVMTYANGDKWEGVWEDDVRMQGAYIHLG